MAPSCDRHSSRISGLGSPSYNLGPLLLHPLRAEPLLLWLHLRDCLRDTGLIFAGAESDICLYQATSGLFGPTARSFCSNFGQPIQGIPWMSTGGDELDEVTVRLRGLSITLRVDDPALEAPSSSASFSVVSVLQAAEPAQSAAGEPEGATDPGPHPTGPLAGGLPLAAEAVTALANRLRDCRTAQELNEVDLVHFEHFSDSLAGSFPWTSRGRIARALRAGFSAGRALVGPVRVVDKTEPIRLRNCWYICLRCASYPGGFATQSFATYKLTVGRRNGAIEEGSISHGFPSRAEATAYLAAAGRPWPAVI